MGKTRTHQQLHDLHGHEYAERFDRTQRPRRLRQLLPLVDLRPEYDVVDFGCGNGLLAAEIYQQVRSYTGVDFSLPFIELASLRAGRLGATNVDFKLSSIGEFCTQNEQRFDAAFALDFSEHVYDAQWTDILRDIRRSLKPGALLYLHTPNAAFLLERMKHHRVLLKQSPEHVAVRTMEHNLSLLTAAGFKIEQARFVKHYNILRFAHGLSALPGIGHLFEARIFISARKGITESVS